jgi:hypothetical protein
MAIFSAGGMSFQITYQANGGTAVMLTRVAGGAPSGGQGDLAFAAFGRGSASLPAGPWRMENLSGPGSTSGLTPNGPVADMSAAVDLAQTPPPRTNLCMSPDGPRLDLILDEPFLWPWIAELG